MTLSVVFTPEAEDQLVELHRYIVAAGSVEVAARLFGHAVVIVGVFYGGRDYEEVLGAEVHE